jgi:4-diphosphocytidyl-2-C-methyl-D-erythritol kinase
VSSAAAHAKVNLALVAGPRRADGKHEIVTVLQRVELHDDVELGPASALEVTGFSGDTLVESALRALARAADVTPAWRAHIEKRIPVAAGLGGGSSDAASALLLANRTLVEPLPADALHAVAARIGADVPFFLREGAQLASGDGTELRALALPTSYAVLLLRPHGVVKGSTGAVYERFDERGGARGFDSRRAALLDALSSVAEPTDLALLPRNDLGSSPFAARLEELGAFRADVSGAGPTVYALFADPAAAEFARDAVRESGETWLTRPLQA